MKLSQWHDGNVKPVHIGVYERLYDEGKSHESIVYCKFDVVWYTYEDNVNDASSKEVKSCVEDVKWRGIVKDKK